MTAAPISLRPAGPEDEPFLRRVYASSREDEMAVIPWSQAEKAAFLDQQFSAQHKYYHENYSDASWDIILVDGQPAGRLYVSRWPEDIRIIDIALLPEYRGRGVGTHLLRALLEEGGASGRKVSIHVELYNPARRLYDRLGFQPASEHGVYVLMEWRPQAGNQQ